MEETRITIKGRDREAALEYCIVEGYAVKEPIRSTGDSAGIDIFIPERTDRFTFDFLKKNSENEFNEEFGKLEENYISIPPHCRVIIPTGLRFNIPKNTYIEVANRGSIAALYGLIRGAFVIDKDFQGIVFINIINTTTEFKRLVYGQKFIQLIHKEYIRSVLRKVPLEEDLYKDISKRGEGSLGSTGI
jgi:dUTP pyrophosphatase